MTPSFLRPMGCRSGDSAFRKQTSVNPGTPGLLPHVHIAHLGLVSHLERHAAALTTSETLQSNWSVQMSMFVSITVQSVRPSFNSAAACTRSLERPWRTPNQNKMPKMRAARKATVTPTGLQCQRHLRPSCSWRETRA